MDRDYSYNSRSRSSDSIRSYIFLDNKKRKGSGKVWGIIAGIAFLLLVAGVVVLFLTNER